MMSLVFIRFAMFQPSIIPVFLLSPDFCLLPPYLSNLPVFLLFFSLSREIAVEAGLFRWSRRTIQLGLAPLAL
jgi:hypothetical protein